MSARNCPKGKKRCSVLGAAFCGFFTAAGMFLFMFMLTDFQAFAKDLEKSKTDALAVLSSQSGASVLRQAEERFEDITPRAVTFLLPFSACPSEARNGEVFLKADFNLWGARAISLERTARGYARTLFLPKGEYKYYFSAGSIEIKDPQCDAAVSLGGKEVSLKKVS